MSQTSKNNAIPCQWGRGNQSVHVRVAIYQIFLFLLLLTMLRQQFLLRKAELDVTKGEWPSERSVKAKWPQETSESTYQQKQKSDPSKIKNKPPEIRK